MVTLQEYLNYLYPTKETKEQVKEIIIGSSRYKNTIEELQELDSDQLDLSEYLNLEKVIINGKHLKSKLTSLDISKCVKLVVLGCYGNELAGLDCSHCPDLEKLECSENKLTDLNINGCAKLNELYYDSNP